MKSKHLAILGIVVVVLVGLVVLKEWREQPPDIVEEAGLQPLVPEGLTAGDIAKVELYKGDKPDAKVVLARSEDGTSWQVASQYGAPVDKTKIESYLEKLVGLKGEARPRAEGDEALAAYELTDDKAFHVLGYRKGEDKPAAHLLIGKEADTRTVFARAADGQDIFQTDANLRREAGVYSQESELKGETWINKKLIEIKPEDVTRLALKTPDRELVLEKQEKPAPEPPKPAEGAEGSETPAPEPPPAPIAEWVLVSGAPEGKPFKQTGPDEFLQAFRTLYAADVVDPSKLAEWGLEQPGFRTAIKLKTQEEEIVIEGGRPAPAAEPGKDPGTLPGTEADKGYIRFAGKEPVVVYEVTGMMFDRIFPKASQFVTLAELGVESGAVDRIELTQPSGHAVFVKQDGQWTIETPKADLNPLTATLETVASTLAGWNPEDYAVSAEGTGLDAPTRTVTFRAGEKTHTIALGGESKGVKGAYAKIDGEATPIVMAKTTVDKVFVAPKDLYERTLLEATALDIERIAVTAPETSFEAIRQDGAPDQWTLTAGGADLPADNSALGNLASSLATLQASDILFDRSQLEGEPMATVRFNLEGQEQTLSIGPAQEGGMHPATLSGKKQVFLLSEADVKGLLPAVDSLKSAPAEEAEAGEAAAAAAAAGEAAEAAEEATASEAAPAETAPKEEAAPAEAAPAPETSAPDAAAPAEAAPAPETAAPADEAPAPDAATPAESAPAPDASAPVEAAPDAPEAPAAGS